MTGLLVLVRHGQSEWNAKNLFTGWRDPPLTIEGRREAHEAARKLRELKLHFDIAFTSALVRAQETCEIILNEMGLSSIEVVKDAAINERDYGELTGLNKAEAAKKFGDEQIHIWRRSYDIPPPGGESLKTTAERVLPYYHRAILPRVKLGQSVIVVAHGNSLRALLMELEALSPEQILKREMKTGAPLLYRIDADGKVVERRDLAA